MSFKTGKEPAPSPQASPKDDEDSRPRVKSSSSKRSSYLDRLAMTPDKADGGVAEKKEDKSLKQEAKKEITKGKGEATEKGKEKEGEDDAPKRQSVAERIAAMKRRSKSGEDAKSLGGESNKAPKSPTSPKSGGGSVADR